MSKIRINIYLIIIRTINEIIDQTINNLRIKANIHENFSSKIMTSIVEEIRLIYLEIAAGKKKYMKILNKEIIKETNEDYAKVMKQQRKDKSMNLDEIDFKTTIQMEFQERNAESN